MSTRTISIRGVPEATLDTLRGAARRQRRSLNAELLTILERAAHEARSGATPGQVRQAAVRPYPRPGLAVDVDRAELARVCRRWHIQSLLLFGSAARNEAGPASDVDLLAEFEPGMTPGFGIVAVAEELAKLFGRRVDLLTRRGLSPRLQQQVLAGAVPLFHA